MCICCHPHAANLVRGEYLRQNFLLRQSASWERIFATKLKLGMIIAIKIELGTIFLIIIVPNSIFVAASGRIIPNSSFAAMISFSL